MFVRVFIPYKLPIFIALNLSTLGLLCHHLVAPFSIILQSKRRAEAMGFRLVRVQQQSADVYEIFDPRGHLWQIRLCDEWGELLSWTGRSEAEKDALFNLAMDEYYGSSCWEEGGSLGIMPCGEYV